MAEVSRIPGRCAKPGAKAVVHSHHGRRTEPPPRDILILASFARAPIEYAREPAWVNRALEIARAANLSTIYDALYLACAETLDADLFTSDRQFCDAFGATLPARVKLVAIAP
jgi:hypothetical protein